MSKLLVLFKLMVAEHCASINEVIHWLVNFTCELLWVQGSTLFGLVVEQAVGSALSR